MPRWGCYTPGTRLRRATKYTPTGSKDCFTSCYFLGKNLFSVSRFCSKNSFFSYCKRSCRAGHILLLPVQKKDARKTPERAATVRFAAKSRPALTKHTAAGATVRKSTRKSPPAVHTLCSNELFTLPRPKRNFLLDDNF